KVFCFNGCPRAIQVDHDRSSRHTRSMYDADWNVLDVEYGYPIGPTEAPPPCLSEMRHVARKLSEPLLFVRVDFYIVGGRPIVGEMTFFPTGGLKPFNPTSFDH